MKLKCKRKIKNTLYTLSAREYVISKSNKFFYCVKKESNFSKYQNIRSCKNIIIGTSDAIWYNPTLHS